MDDSVDGTSLSLLARVRQHDREAWSRFSNIYGPLVYHWARRCQLSAEDAADVTQEVFSVVAQKLEGFRSERPGDTFRGWLWTITRNKVRDHCRKAGGQAQAAGGTEAYRDLQQLADHAAEPWEDDKEKSVADQGVVSRALKLIRAEFEANTWQAFCKVTVDGRTAAEAARELGMTTHAVHQAKYRVLRRLRSELE